MTYLTKKEIQQIIPHREPFVLIDAVEEVEFGRYGVGVVADVGQYPFFRQLQKLKKDSQYILVDQVRVDREKQTAYGLIEDVAKLQPLFAGHFPHQPIFPGVLTFAALAEVACHLLSASADAPGITLKQADGWRFKQIITPGHKVELKAEQKGDGLVAVQAELNGKAAASGRLMFAPLPKSNSKQTIINTQFPQPVWESLLQALTLEAMAEVGAVAVLGLKEYQNKVAFLASLNKWQFYQPVKIGQPLTFKASLLDLRQSFGKGHFLASSADGQVSEGEMLFGLG